MSYASVWVWKSTFVQNLFNGRYPIDLLQEPQSGRRVNGEHLRAALRGFFRPRSDRFAIPFVMTARRFCISTASLFLLAFSVEGEPKPMRSPEKEVSLSPTAPRLDTIIIRLEAHLDLTREEGKDFILVE
jgi:hypothetical protein